MSQHYHGFGPLRTNNKEFWPPFGSICRMRHWTKNSWRQNAAPKTIMRGWLGNYLPASRMQWASVFIRNVSYWQEVIVWLRPLLRTEMPTAVDLTIRQSQYLWQVSIYGRRDDDACGTAEQKSWEEVLCENTSRLLFQFPLFQRQMNPFDDASDEATVNVLILSVPSFAFCYDGHCMCCSWCPLNTIWTFPWTYLTLI